MQWRPRKQAKSTVAPYYAKAGAAPPRPLPLPREITWPWTNGKPLPMPDCSNRPCGTIGKQIKGATAVEGCRLLPAMPKATAKSCAIAPAAPPGAIAAVTPARTEGKDPELHKWVQRWIEQLASASRASPVFCNLGDAGPASLECMLSQKAAGTANCHNFMACVNPLLACSRLVSCCCELHTGGTPTCVPFSAKADGIVCSCFSFSFELCCRWQ